MPRAVVTQSELGEILLLEQQIEKMSQIEKTLKAKQLKVLGKINKGSKVEAGALVATNKQWERTVISWKEVAERELGKPYITRVIAGTPPTTYDKLVIETAPNVAVASVSGSVSY